MESHSNHGGSWAPYAVGRHADRDLKASPFADLFGATTYVWGSRPARDAVRLEALRRELGLRPGRWPMKPARPVS